MNQRRRRAGTRRVVPHTVRFKKNYVGHESFFTTQTKKRRYETIKEGVIPRFNELTDGQQEYLRSIIATTQGITSKSLEATTLLSARQIGQLKRRFKEQQGFLVSLP